MVGLKIRLLLLEIEWISQKGGGLREEVRDRQQAWAVHGGEVMGRRDRLPPLPHQAIFYRQVGKRETFRLALPFLFKRGYCVPQNRSEQPFHTSEKLWVPTS